MKLNVIFFGLVLVSVSFYIPHAFAQDVLIMHDVYVDSDVPSRAPWKVKLVSTDQTISVYCDKTSESVFKMGKTTVHCTALDASGNESRSSLVVTVGYTVVHIPEWFKIPTGFWLDGKISDDEYVASIETLMRQGLLHIPAAKATGDSIQDVPAWVKQNSQKWTDGKISDDEFSICLQWLIKNKIV